MAMLYLFLAELVVVFHFVFILFVLFGGLLLLRWPRLVWLHLPAAVWGTVVVAMGWICPLTPLEKKLRVAAGEEAYGGGYVSQYLIPLIYPDGLQIDLQLALAVLVVTVNGIIYACLFWKRSAS